jgi:hypothetical protein
MQRFKQMQASVVNVALTCKALLMGNTTIIIIHINRHRFRQRWLWT